MVFGFLDNLKYGNKLLGWRYFLMLVVSDFASGYILIEHLIPFLRKAIVENPELLFDASFKELLFYGAVPIVFSIVASAIIIVTVYIVLALFGVPGKARRQLSRMR